MTVLILVIPKKGLISIYKVRCEGNVTIFLKTKFDVYFQPPFWRKCISGNSRSLPFLCQRRGDFCIIKVLGMGRNWCKFGPQVVINSHLHPQKSSVAQPSVPIQVASPFEDSSGPLSFSYFHGILEDRWPRES